MMSLSAQAMSAVANAASEAVEALLSPIRACMGVAVMDYARSVSRRFAFADCNDAAKSFQEMAARNESAAWTNYEGLEFTSSDFVEGKDENGKPMYSTTLAWRVKPGFDIALPEWTNVSEADRAAWDEVVSALQVHEEGHIRIVQCYADELRADPLSASGGTLPEAEAALRARIKAREQEVDKALKQKQEQYDELTRSGQNQEILGGKNAILDCKHQMP